MLLSSGTAPLRSAMAVLDFGRATHGIHDAGELDEQAVTCCLDDPTAMLADFAIDKLVSCGP